ncbi:zinc-binding dehydrogenase [Bacilliculturomica massiliensis]|uniref:zinc-binding dehydrogenase n=1 Tax=Bacilliculturomica massiliensis TaxID=1917867 RepID=UPI001FE7279C|nr:alcohol dehydrogenase catalytic domain-containing protein [Bacilliculturomica massiliensis]
MRKMKAVILKAPNDFAPGEIDIPAVGDGDILLEMKKAAICGTDIRILEGKKTKGVRYPSVIGHEICGLVKEVGRDVKGFAPGDKVAVANVIPCHSCRACLAGRENACMDRKAIGYEFNGGFEEYVLIPRLALESGNVVKLPDHVSFEEGALIEPLSCCIRGLRNAGTGFNDNVLIVGAGPIGLMHLQLAKIAGARRVIVSEPIASRREKAKKLGADIAVDPTEEDLEAIVMAETDGAGMDVIVMAIGVPALVDPTLKLCRKGGTVNLFAGFAGTGACTVEVNTIHYNEITVNGSTAYRRQDYYDAAEMVKSGKIDLKEIVTHTFKIEEFQKAYEVCKSGAGLKVLIEP